MKEYPKFFFYGDVVCETISLMFSSDHYKGFSTGRTDPSFAINEFPEHCTGCSNSRVNQRQLKEHGFVFQIIILFSNHENGFLIEK